MVVPIIPALNPDEKLIKIVDELRGTFKKIIIVNDGSENDDIFNKLKKNKECIVLTHDINLGKGRALKTAFKYYQDNLINDYAGVIALDADGQHKVSDVIKICDVLEKKDKFILGTRLFNTEDTPWRNKLGNRITSRVFKWLYGVYIKDTQTGLRARPNRLIPFLLKVDGDRFEYEINELIALVKKKEIIEEVDIETVYLHDSNKKSHFKVFKDSYRIYKILFKKRKEKLKD